MAVPRCYCCRVRSLACRYQPLLSSRRTLPSNSNSFSQEILSIPVDSNETSSLPPNHAALENELVGAVGETENIFLPPFPDYDLDWQEAMANIETFSVPDQLTVNDAPSKNVLAGKYTSIGLSTPSNVSSRFPHSSSFAVRFLSFTRVCSKRTPQSHWGKCWVFAHFTTENPKQIKCWLIVLSISLPVS
jgi:hypothetical protein